MPPLYRIEYTTPETANAIVQSVEWVTASDWNADRTCQEFQRRHPNAAILQCKPIQCS